MWTSVSGRVIKEMGNAWRVDDRVWVEVDACGDRRNREKEIGK